MAAANTVLHSGVEERKGTRRFPNAGGKTEQSRAAQQTAQCPKATSGVSATAPPRARRRHRRRPPPAGQQIARRIPRRGKPGEPPWAGPRRRCSWCGRGATMPPRWPSRTTSPSPPPAQVALPPPPPGAFSFAHSQRQARLRATRQECEGLKFSCRHARAGEALVRVRARPINPSDFFSIEVGGTPACSVCLKSPTISLRC